MFVCVCVAGGRNMDERGSAAEWGGKVAKGTFTAYSAIACCSVLQRVAVRCGELRFVAVCCSVLQCVSVLSRRILLLPVAVCCSVLQCVAACCGEMWCIAVSCGVFRVVSVYCSTFSCSVSQCVAVC